MDDEKAPSLHYVVVMRPLVSSIEAFEQVEALARAGFENIVWLTSTDGKVWKEVNWR